MLWTDHMKKKTQPLCPFLLKHGINGSWSSISGIHQIVNLHRKWRNIDDHGEWENDQFTNSTLRPTGGCVARLVFGCGD